MNPSQSGSPGDLGWLAQRYVLEELTPEESAAFEDQLAHDEAAAEALVSAVKLIGAVQAAGVAGKTLAAPVPQMPARRLGWLVGLALSVGLFMVAVSRFGRWPVQDAGAGEAAALVSMWNQSGTETVVNGDSDSEADLVASDDVPEWLIAAVASAGTRDDSVQVQEN